MAISAIYDEADYQAMREKLASQYTLGDREPNIQVVRVDRRVDRAVCLRHSQFRRRQ